MLFERAVYTGVSEKWLLFLKAAGADLEAPSFSRQAFLLWREAGLFLVSELLLPLLLYHVPHLCRVIVRWFICPDLFIPKVFKCPMKIFFCSLDHHATNWGKSLSEQPVRICGMGGKDKLEDQVNSCSLTPLGLGSSLETEIGWSKSPHHFWKADTSGALQQPHTHHLAWPLPKPPQSTLAGWRCLLSRGRRPGLSSGHSWGHHKKHSGLTQSLTPCCHCSRKGPSRWVPHTTRASLGDIVDSLRTQSMCLGSRVHKMSQTGWSGVKSRLGLPEA